MRSLSIKASGRPFCRDHGDILCCTEPYHANVDMMIRGSFHRRDTFRSASCQPRLLCDLLLPMRAARCSSQNHAAPKQDEQLLSCTIRNTEHRPPCQVTLRYKPPVNVKVIRVHRTTAQCKCSTDHHWDLFANNETGDPQSELPSCGSKLLRERASHTSWWCGVFHKTTQCDNKANNC